MPTISREQAQSIAEAYLVAHLALKCSGIREVFALEEIRWQTPLVYGITPDRMKGYWIAYGTCPSDEGWICSSTVVLVSMETGTVDFAGNASDEG